MPITPLVRTHHTLGILFDRVVFRGEGMLSGRSLGFHVTSLPLFRMLRSHRRGGLDSSFTIMYLPGLSGHTGSWI